MVRPYFLSLCLISFLLQGKDARLRGERLKVRCIYFLIKLFKSLSYYFATLVMLELDSSG